MTNPLRESTDHALRASAMSQQHVRDQGQIVGQSLAAIPQVVQDARMNQARIAAEQMRAAEYEQRIMQYQQELATRQMVAQTQQLELEVANFRFEQEKLWGPVERTVDIVARLKGQPIPMGDGRWGIVGMGAGGHASIREISKEDYQALTQAQGDGGVDPKVRIDAARGILSETSNAPPGEDVSESRKRALGVLEEIAGGRAGSPLPTEEATPAKPTSKTTHTRTAPITRITAKDLGVMLQSTRLEPEDHRLRERYRAVYPNFDANMARLINEAMARKDLPAMTPMQIMMKIMARLRAGDVAMDGTLAIEGGLVDDPSVVKLKQELAR